MGSRYIAALVGWTLGGVAAPVAAAVALGALVAIMCGGASDCSWGFELLLVLPVLIVSFFVWGPSLVKRNMARVDADAGPEVARWTRIGAGVALVVLYLGAGSGMGGFVSMLFVTTLGVPALVVARTARSQ